MTRSSVGIRFQFHEEIFFLDIKKYKICVRLSCHTLGHNDLTMLKLYFWLVSSKGDEYQVSFTECIEKNVLHRVHRENFFHRINREDSRNC